MTKRYVDPPSGWKYGFPKLLPYPEPEGFDFYQWLVDEGYPQREIDRMGNYFFCRQWDAADGE